ncbi:hypothetical protein TRFO_05101 [Tritrichomonas foetus]|uniref:Uncharacterized protein n=1 Tax=Tritrichomonas foetus TaxID=1144522 RepID=A0A1J4K8Y6_9EUKA|nr:hypothetical protein TRFO_05101 [Tritrichomonas foetus]|eukprot:OHT07961.1 hypothetical protein TRFO_05101 [Tritrichomonas foetus]
MGEESLLNFDDFNDDVTPKNQTQPQKNSQGGLFGAFDDISFTDNNEKPTEFVFSGDDNANANDLSFNPFGETSFNPTFPNPSASNQGNDNFDEIDNRPKQTPMRLRPSGPRPKFDPNKMKKKKVVANTVPQGDFDPFGTGNASAAFANIQSTEEPKKYVSLAERFGGASQQQQQGSNDQKQQPKQTTSGGGNVFDLLGISGSEDEDDTPQQNIQLNSNSNTQPVKPQPNQQQQIQQKGSHDLFDMLGDDAIVDSSPSANNSTSQAQQGSGNLFESFTTPQQTQPKAQQQQPKQNSANVFDMLDGDVFGGEPKQNETPKQQSNAVFEPFGAVSPNSSNKPKDSSNMFDSFTPSFQPQQQSPQPQQGSGNVFDMLDASPAPPSKQQGNSNDLFESFAAPAQPQKPQQQPQKASRDVFDMLGDFGQPNTAPSQPQQQKSANVFDMLDDFNPPQQPQGSGNAFVSPPVQQPQQQQQGQSGARNVFDFL